ncbi:MAG: hypothetical protein AB7S80_20000, partial [Rhizobiaceae bacterium]
GPTNILAGSITTFSAGDNAIGGQSDVTIASGAVLALITAAFQALPGQTFTVNGARPARNSALLDLGIEASSTMDSPPSSASTASSRATSPASARPPG